jgi:signal transduction histidine kinase
VHKIEALVAHAEESVAGELQKRGIVCKKTIAPNLPAVRVHGEAAACLLLTLLQNAARFSPDGGEIEIDVRLDASSERVVTEIRDQGPGIPAENREKIFEPFFTTAVDGLGMGLFVASRIADLQDIQLQLMPTPPRGGAVFRIGFRQPGSEMVEPAPATAAL